MTRCILLVVLLALGLPHARAELKFPTLTVGTTTYSNVVITDANDTDIFLTMPTA